MESSGTNPSVWMRDTELQTRQPLAEDISCDVCIVGAGIAGLTAAYLLCQAGRSVVVVDDGPIAGGETGRTTAHLSNVLDDRYSRVEGVVGEEAVQHACEAHSSAIHRIEAICRLEKIDCEFVRLPGYLMPPTHGRHPHDVLEKELDACRRAGLAQAEMTARLPMHDGGPAPCIRFPDQAQFMPLQYMIGLAAAIERRGGRIFTGSHVSEIEGGDDCRTATASGPTIASNAVIVATNVPVNDWVKMHTKLFPYRTYALAAPVAPGAVPPALYWDMDDPYHYVRLARAQDADMLIVGGEDHKTGQAHDAEERWTRLERWARGLFPQMGPVACRWSGQVVETLDGLAYIGPNPGDKDNVYIATGDSGMGMTHGTIAGILLTDLIMGRANSWAHVFDPARKPVRAAGEFLKENINVAGQYAGWMTPGQVKSVEQIAPGSGAVLRDGLHKVCVYRDDSGRPHAFSASCPHLGCVLSWNDAEKTWDCPCHGSRFDARGQVINGPANHNLRHVELKQEAAKGGSK